VRETHVSLRAAGALARDHAQRARAAAAAAAVSAAGGAKGGGEQGADGFGADDAEAPGDGHASESRAEQLQRHARMSAEKPAASGATRAEVAELATLARSLLAKIQALEEQHAVAQE
jgi:hypothetical protein